MAKTYYEKLKDPRWQKKRLEVLERDEWTCKICKSVENTLNVHHKKYAKSGNPWDVELVDLETYCESCHEKYETNKKKILNALENANYLTKIVDIDIAHLIFLLDWNGNKVKVYYDLLVHNYNIVQKAYQMGINDGENL